jgi:hypothetical protein
LRLPVQKACVIFNKISVNSIENSSGIFIGTNQAFGWKSISTSNEGFGSLHDAFLTNCTNVVFDSDFMDTTIKDVTYIQETEASKAQQSYVEFKSINSNALNNGSVIDIGNNKQPGWNNSRKTNYGSGRAIGANRYSRITNIVFDNDNVDSPIHIESNISGTSESVDNEVLIHQKP